MTGWDVLNNLGGGFPFVVTGLFILTALAALVIFIAGFAKHGTDFLKHGFKQLGLAGLADRLATKDDINRLDTKFETRFEVLETKFETRFEALETKIELIETNHFGHLKNYLGILNGVLLDKKIIDNETRARMDNELRGM